MRSKLFVPGSRPELFEKAWRTDADALSFDLEDSVPAGSKSRAREFVAEALNSAPRPRSKIAIVRMNRLDGPDFEEDIQAVVRPGLDVINLPKIEDAEAVREAAGKLNELETKRGIDRRIRISSTSKRRAACGKLRKLPLPAIGSSVFSLALAICSHRSASKSLATMTPIWLAVRLAAAEAGVPAYDAAFVGVADLEAFRAEAIASRAVGFAGKSCVHPRQSTSPMRCSSPARPRSKARDGLSRALTKWRPRRRRLHGGGRHVRWSLRDARPRDRQAGG